MITPRKILATTGSTLLSGSLMGGRLAADVYSTAARGRTGLVTPEHFDAPANGNDDDSPAFSAAMECLSSIGGGTLHFSAGKRYRCNSTISIPDNCGIDGGLSSPGFVPDLNYAAKAGSLLLSEDARIVSRKLDGSS